MNRRQFINRSAALLAIGSIAGQNACSTTSARRIGIQLYSVRNDLPVDFEGTLRKISEMGYSSVETYGLNEDKFFNYTMKDFRALISDMGMSISGTHAGSRILPEDTNEPEWDYWKKLAETLKTVDAGWAVQAGFPGAGTIDDLKRIAEHFNRVGEICRQGGVKFAYHNHHRELGKIDDVVILEYLIKNTNPETVFFQLDMGHVVRGGGDCLRLLREYPTRIPLWHASDYNAETVQYTDIGKGNVPYAEMFGLPKSGGLEVLTVEQETLEDIFGSLQANFDYLKQFRWTRM